MNLKINKVQGSILAYFILVPVLWLGNACIFQYNFGFWREVDWVSIWYGIGLILMVTVLIPPGTRLVLRFFFLELDDIEWGPGVSGLPSLFQGVMWTFYFPIGWGGVLRSHGSNFLENLQAPREDDRLLFGSTHHYVTTISHGGKIVLAVLAWFFFGWSKGYPQYIISGIGFRIVLASLVMMYTGGVAQVVEHKTGTYINTLSVPLIGKPIYRSGAIPSPASNPTGIKKGDEDLAPRVQAETNPQPEPVGAPRQGALISFCNIVPPPAPTSSIFEVAKNDATRYVMTQAAPERLYVLYVEGGINGHHKQEGTSCYVVPPGKSVGVYGGTAPVCAINMESEVYVYAQEEGLSFLEQMKRHTRSGNVTKSGTLGVWRDIKNIERIAPSLDKAAPVYYDALPLGTIIRETSSKKKEGHPPFLGGMICF